MTDGKPSEEPVVPAIGSRSEFAAAVRWALQASVTNGARRILWVDRDFADWPLDDPALHGALADWLRLPQRRLVMLATDYGHVPRRHPRFTAWRKIWVHAIEAWTPADGAADELPTLAIDDGAVSVHLIDAVHWRGRVSLDDRAAKLWRDQIDAVLQRSETAFPATSLGL